MNKKPIIEPKARQQARVKIEDVARKANVSPATVSRVLNHPEIVRPELRDKVMRHIADLSYTRDSAARALKSGRMRTIGVIVPTLALGIFAEGVEALQNRLSESGYTLFIANSQYDQRRELQELQSLIERGIDGIVLVGGSHGRELRALIEQAAVPVITTYVCKAAGGIPAIGIDNEGATRDMTEYLLGLGHVRFGVIANVNSPSNDRSRARLEGIQRALAKVEIPLKPTQIIRTDYSLVQGRNALRQLLTDHPDTTAVVCTTDTLAIGAMAEARKMGSIVPAALSITGFDDVELAAQMDPPLTTISVPAAEIGRGAADYLINAIAGTPVPRSVLLPYRLVMRSSTAPPKSGERPARRPRTRGQ
ncbi:MULTISPECIES: LacI family DNA-binding transcriptional regulator [Bradyrhizobium]|uniref:LacI family DNA-binding transcriptional regulator n=1 Tax=Bradyrhizobium TaxID=374 RepID=UPI0021AAC85E|nr:MULTISPECIES: LacI family DNA-binding transcriptional regulator [Bradyrhizobium]MDF0492995.1 LacI family DNA-binding transcriptional regulator [Bradyrhizobium yuanmingense]UWU67718.1 LacI family DNA-binding transcriptional regulator [Bradyrhizobium sp. NC92]